jgi:hypothetical protein
MLNDKEEMLGNAFGMWISALFSDIAGYNPNLSFLEQKQQFFILVKELLDGGRIKFCTPNEIWSKDNDVWDAESEEIIKYLEAKWPVLAQSERDLSEYFYEIPAVLWVDEQGNLIGS